MSSDEIFAAHMWPWPDPMLKRDAHGRILFINAAFLRMYGGQVADWQGNSVAGWPMPAGPGAPNRFETRLPSASGEQIYDWIEYTLADGGTLAIARDVTTLLAAPEPDPGYEMAPIAPPQMPQTNYAAAAQGESTHAPAYEPQTAEAYVPPQEQVAAAAAPAEPEIPTFEVPQIDVPEIEVPSYEAPAYEAPASAPVPYEDLAQAAAPEAQPLSPPLTEDTAPPVAEASMPLPETPGEAPADTPVKTNPLAPERDYERRALPIENEDAVLGTNWRDAVIAKAVGNALPKAEEVEAEDEPPAPTIMKSEGPLRILLAEDNAINALLTRTLLEADGCHVDVVEDGALAVEAMKNQSYDMIFMDMRMPNMDGLESTRKIRALPNVPATLPIVALTANAFDDDRNACFDSGMNDFMTKPVSAEELADMVNQWARKDQEAAA